MFETELTARMLGNFVHGNGLVFSLLLHEIVHCRDIPEQRQRKIFRDKSPLPQLPHKNSTSPQPKFVPSLPLSCRL